jgi:hypothetical protein
VLCATHSWFLTRVTRKVPLVLQHLPTLPEHLSSPPVFSGVGVARSLVFCAVFVVRCLSLCTFSFGHCVGCPSTIYGFWLLLWFLVAIILSVLLWFTDSDCPFGFFRLFLYLGHTLQEVYNIVSYMDITYACSPNSNVNI